MNITGNTSLVSDRKIRNHTIRCKLFVLDRNMWNNLTVCKQMIVEKCNGTLKM